MVICAPNLPPVLSAVHREVELRHDLKCPLLSQICDVGYPFSIPVVPQVVCLYRDFGNIWKEQCNTKPCWIADARINYPR
jgi:hypothetical protein